MASIECVIFPSALASILLPHGFFSDVLAVIDKIALISPVPIVAKTIS
jgi:hypothetical protein